MTVPLPEARSTAQRLEDRGDHITLFQVHCVRGPCLRNNPRADEGRKKKSLDTKIDPHQNVPQFMSVCFYNLIKFLG